MAEKIEQKLSISLELCRNCLKDKYPQFFDNILICGINLAKFQKEYAKTLFKIPENEKELDNNQKYQKFKEMIDIDSTTTDLFDGYSTRNSSNFELPPAAENVSFVDEISDKFFFHTQVLRSTIL